MSEVLHVRELPDSAARRAKDFESDVYLHATVSFLFETGIKTQLPLSPGKIDAQLQMHFSNEKRSRLLLQLETLKAVGGNAN